jgi:8-amino-3,8-dideoxy-alpha-D-manno-octulosonate transaminase
MPGSELIGIEELQEIQRLFESEKIILYRYGPNNYKTHEFEKKFADYMGVKYAHAVSSGTAAIHSALAAAGVKSGDEVITTAWTFVAPIEAIVSLNAIPILANIDETYHLDPKEVESLITEKTKAIVVVPMWAAPNMDILTELCRKYNLILIEDAAQSLGASYKGKKLGTFGQLGTFSFDFGKTIHTGEGGMIITNDKKSYDKAAEFSDHGHMHVDNIPRGKDPRRSPGLNYRMSELTAAVGIAQLNKIDYILSKSKENKYKLKDSIRDLGKISFRKFSDEEGAQGDTMIFSLESSDQALDFEKTLNDNGFGTKILPEAIDWHYGGSWSHIFDRYDQYGNIVLEKRYKKTGDLLRRSICLNIPILIDENTLNKLSSIIINYFS